MFGITKFHYMQVHLVSHSLRSSETRSEIGSFPVSNRASVLKLWKDEAVAWGHFDGMASSFDITKLSKQPLQCFRAHTASVLSVDVNTVR